MSYTSKVKGLRRRTFRQNSEEKKNLFYIFESAIFAFLS